MYKSEQRGKETSRGRKNFDWLKLHRSLCCQLTDPCLVIITRVIISRIKLILELYRHGHLLRLVSIMIDEKVWLLIRLREIEKTRVFFKFDAKIGNWLGLATNIPIFLIFWSKSTLLKFFAINNYNFEIYWFYSRFDY